MDLSVDDDQQALVDAFGQFFRQQSTPEVVRAAEPLGFSPAVWSGLTAMGVPGLESDESLVSLVTLALITEQAGRWLAPAPIVESLITARLLRRAGCDPDRLTRVFDGSEIVTIALSPPTEGLARLVPAGAVAHSVIALDGRQLVMATSTPPSETLATLGANAIANRPIAEELVGERVILAEDDEAESIYATALDEWRVLTAAALVGLAQQALEIGVAYVLERRQFGVQIGSFQSIQHRLADIDTALSGAVLLEREAAWAADEGLPNAGALASMAFLFAGDIAQQAADASLHFHGGYGFMLEYDIQLYFRRAKAWTLIQGDPKKERLRLADLLWGEVPVS